MREKWCGLVSHIALEPLDTKTAPRKVTVYLSAPPGDGLRAARDHFHKYVKPVLVSAAMDWDVVEGRKEGDVRHKTSERIRKRRKRNGEGSPQPQEDEDGDTVETIRQKNGDVDYPGVAGDIVIGRHTWKEYIRGVHEGYLGPPDPPKQQEQITLAESSPASHVSGHPSVADAAVRVAADAVSQSAPNTTGSSGDAQSDVSPTASDSTEASEAITSDKPDEQQAKEEEKPKRRFPVSYILPEDYQSATLSPSTPEIIGPSIGVRLPHLLGFRNTPIRIYRFLTRRRLQDDIGRQVASAILASHRPFGTVSVKQEDNASNTRFEVPEQQAVLEFEEKDWWKTVRQPRKEHEESVWIEPIALDERIASRMRAFDLTSDEAERAKRWEAESGKFLGTHE